MTEKQQEIYIRTKERLRRMGKENPADVIVALAEEIDRYRERIHTLEEFIANRERKHGNETALVAELRNKTSRDNRDLLDRAADRIEELEADQRKQSEGIANNATTTGGWISVDERLPKQWEMVLVCCDDIISTDFISSHGRWYEHIDHTSVTHWMPLPEAPKMKGGAE